MTPENTNKNDGAKPINVLIIEDSADDAVLIEHELRKSGYSIYAKRVETAETMRAALEREAWDIILSDYSMPNFSALAALKILKTSPYDLPFIIISGAIGEEIAVECLKSGAHDYLIKGKLTRLASAVKRELACAEQRRQRKRDVLLLRENETKYRSIFNQAAVGVARVALDGTWLATNQKLCDMVGYSHDELSNKTFQEITHPDDLKLDQAYVNQLLNNEIQTCSFEKRYIKKTGEIVWVNLTGSMVLNQDNAPDYFIAIIVDITARKKAEERSSRLAAAVEQAIEAVIITDLDAKILYTNPAFKRITGYSSDEVLGKNPRFLQSGKHSAEFYQKMWDALTNGEPWQGHLSNKRKDGSFYEEEATISPLRNAAGTIINYVGVKLDVTYEKELQQQIRQSQKMEAVGRLAGGMAHDFNNILQGIFGYCDMLLDQIPEEDTSRKDILEIHNAADRAAELISQLLAFSRLQLIRPTVLDLNTVVDNTSKMLRRLIGEDIELITKQAPDLYRIKADEGSIEQIIMNLAVNARDAMPAGGQLTISTYNTTLDPQCTHLRPSAPHQGEFACLSVTDTGCGMTKEIQEHIFEPFFTTKGVGKGTGLGMASVYGTVQQSHGFLDIRSAPQKGTTCIIYLPLHAEIEPPTEANVSPPLSRGTETILLVEDQESVRITATASLKALGYTVLAANTPEQAFRFIEEHSGSINLLITDVIMPSMNGRDLAALMLDQYPELKSIFISGNPSSTIVQNGILDSGKNFLPKPFNRAQLAKLVREVLDEE